MARRKRILTARVKQSMKKARGPVATVRQRNALRGLEQFRPDPAAPVDIVVNFPDGMRNIYQLRQWYGPLQELAKRHSVAILCYLPNVAVHVAEETDLKVVLTPSYTDLTEVKEVMRPKLIFYVNQNYSNYRILSLADSAHVFLCHGESDKIYMASNWLKVFNYFFVAGQAAQDRIKGNLLNYDPDERTIPIGRPQIDVPTTPEIEKNPGRTMVLYAPTWEGGRPNMAYGSVASHGVKIVRALLDDDRFQVIYRPHPRTGVRLKSVKKANQRIKKMIKAARSRNPQAGHALDKTPFGWQLNEADVMITDVSAVAYDWLTTAKPLLITRPSAVRTPAPEEGLMAHLDLVESSDASDIVALLDERMTDSRARAELQSWSRYYYGDRVPGSSLQRFFDAVDRVVTERDVSVSGALQNQSHIFVEDTTKHWMHLSRKIVNYGSNLTKPFFAGQARRDAEATKTLAESGRHFDVTVSCMGAFDEIGNLIRWLPALEQLSKHISVLVVVGNHHTYAKLAPMTSLPVFYGRGNGETERIVEAARPSVGLHFDQARLNLRETTYRDMLNVYVGDDTGHEWVNNRLRLFDGVVLPTTFSGLDLSNALIDFPSEIEISHSPSPQDTNAAMMSLGAAVERARNACTRERALREARRVDLAS